MPAKRKAAPAAAAAAAPEAAAADTEDATKRVKTDGKDDAKAAAPAAKASKRKGGAATAAASADEEEAPPAAGSDGKVSKKEKAEAPLPTGPALEQTAIVGYTAELRYFGRSKKEKKKCGGCRKAIGPGTLRVYFVNSGCRHINKCWHAGLAHGRYYTASGLLGWDELKAGDAERVNKRLKELFVATTEIRQKDGHTIYGWAEKDITDPKRWTGLRTEAPVAVNYD